MTALSTQGALPLIFLLGFLAACGMQRGHWMLARATALLGVVVAIAALAGGWLDSPAADRPGVAMALLVALLGWVIINYSHRYLQGEPRQALFVRAVLFTLACVSLLVVTRHLLVIVLAWSGTSIGLHYLLTFYRERKAAQIVAHKKFIVSRLADLCLLVAVVLIYRQAGTLALPDLGGYLSGYLNTYDDTANRLPLSLQAAATLFALAAILKSAQLPLHGWLIQVMEAPTPVSALLHAGVVNIGGFVLIRLGDLVALAPPAQGLLVVVGSCSAVLAGLVMMTRISIKVRLAWSTCAQMGFMLMEIGLGLYELALLHLVAHSFYKAHAFLAAGDTVADTRQTGFFPAPAQSRSILWYGLAALQSAVIVALSLALWQWLVPGLELSLAAAVIVALGLASLLWLEQGVAPAQLARGWLQVAALTQLYVLWHLLFANLAPPLPTVAPLLALWVMASFGALYALQVWLRRYPNGRLARLVFPWAYCGFYLDESFTRLTFKVWPARLSPRQAQTLVNKHPVNSGEIA